MCVCACVCACARVCMCVKEADCTDDTLTLIGYVWMFIILISDEKGRGKLCYVAFSHTFSGLICMQICMLMHAQYLMSAVMCSKLIK